MDYSKNNRNHKRTGWIKIIRWAIALICLIAGGIFMIIPFIPLGYILIIAGLLLLATEIPFLKKLLDKLNRKDKKNRVEKVVKKVEKVESEIDKKIESNNK